MAEFYKDMEMVYKPEMEKLRKDAERLDYLEKHQDDIVPIPGFFLGNGQTWGYRLADSTIRSVASLRDAIDKAMQASRRRAAEGME